MWGLAITPFITGNAVKEERVKPLFYILPPGTFLILWFFSRFKQVTLDGDTLIVRSSRREARIPVSEIKQIYKRGGRMTYVSLIFKSKTRFGRCVRIGTMDLRGVEKMLRVAMEGKDLRVKINRTAREPATTVPHQKEIIVKGWTDEELSTILTDFADAYGDRLGKEFEFAVGPHGGGTMRITFPHDIPPQEFSFLVNYLNYPKNFDLKKRSILVAGNVTLSSDFHLPDKNLIGKNAVFYVPADDEDYDLVYINIGNKTFENSFAGFRWKEVEDPRFPAGFEIFGS